MFQSLGHDDLLSRHSSHPTVKMARMAIQIEAMQVRLLERCKRTEIIQFGWRKECDDISCLTYENATADIDRRCHAEFTVQTESPDKRMDVQLNVNDGNRSLVLLVCIFSMEVFETFLDYEPSIDEGNKVKGSISQLARPDAFVATIVSCLTQRKTWGLRQKLSSDTYAISVKQPINQPLGRVPSFFNVWEPKELQIPTSVSHNDKVEIRKNAFLEQPRNASLIISIPSEIKAFIAVNYAWFSNYVPKNLGHIYDCYIAEVV